MVPAVYTDNTGMIMHYEPAEGMLAYSSTVKPPNKGHFGNNNNIINSAVLSLIERLSSSRRFSMNRNYRGMIVFGTPNSVLYREV